MNTIEMNDARISIDENPENGTLHVKFILGEDAVANYITADHGGVVRCSFLPKKEAVFVAWANKHKVPSIMLRSGWRELHSDTQRVPPYAQLIFVIEQMLDSSLRLNNRRHIVAANPDALIYGSEREVTILSGLSALPTDRQGASAALRRFQHQYEKIASQLGEDEYFINSASTLEACGVKTIAEKHLV